MVVVGDRSGNLYTFSVFIADKEPTVKFSKNDASIGIVIENRVDNELRKFDVFVNDILVDSSLVADKGRFSYNGHYRVEIVDVYSNEEVNTIYEVIKNTSDKEYKKAIDNFEKRKVFYSKEEKLVRSLNHIGKRWFISNIELIYYWNDSRELLVEKLANSSGSNANGVRIRLSNIKWILEENLLKDAFMICKSSKNLTSKNINIEEKIPSVNCKSGKKHGDVI